MRTSKKTPLIPSAVNGGGRRLFCPCKRPGYEATLIPHLSKTPHTACIYICMIREKLIQKWYRACLHREHHCDCGRPECKTEGLLSVVAVLVVVVVGMSSSPRLESSCSSHFLVVPSSLRTEEKVESLSWTGRHCRRASRALHRTRHTHDSRLTIPK